MTMTADVSENSGAHPGTGFTASARLAGALQQVLVDLTALHLQLDEIVDAAREASDLIAERMRALHATPDARAETVAATTGLSRFPAGEQIVTTVVDLLTQRLTEAARTARDVHDEVDAEDPATSDLLHAIIVQLEKQAWMVSAENRSI